MEKFSPTNRNITRRHALKMGIGTAGLGLLNQYLPGFARSAEAITPKTRSTILIMLTGGMSRLDSLDYKPKAVSDIRGPFKGIPAANGEYFSELFPHLAKTSNRFALLQSMKSTSSGEHQQAYREWLNAADVHLPTTLSKNGRIPYVDAVTPNVLPLMEPERNELRLNEALQIIWDDQKKEYALEQFAGIQPELVFNENGELVTPPKRQNIADTNIDDRVRLRNALNELSPLRTDKTQRMDELIRVAHMIKTQPVVEELKASLDDQVLNRYGNNPYGTIMKMAGIFASRLQTGMVIVETGHWDHHWNIEGRMQPQAQMLDQSVAALIEEYADECVICMRGEFGRTPRLNDGSGSEAKRAGRDHDAVHTGLIAGPTIRPGVYGCTTQCGRAIDANPITDGQFANTVLAAANGTVSKHGITIPRILTFK